MKKFWAAFLKFRYYLSLAVLIVWGLSYGMYYFSGGKDIYQDYPFEDYDDKLKNGQFLVLNIPHHVGGNFENYDVVGNSNPRISFAFNDVDWSKIKNYKLAIVPGRLMGDNTLGIWVINRGQRPEIINLSGYTYNQLVKYIGDMDKTPQFPVLIEVKDD